MAIKIGDRVRFLNAVGGGIVRRFEGKDIVLVEEDDGFEIPVLIRECVVIDSVSSTTNFPEKQCPKPILQAPIIIREELEPEYQYKAETPEGEKLTVFLAFLPTDGKKLQTTDYTAYLINDSNYFLFYTISTAKEKNQDPCSQGIVEPNTKIELCEITKEQLNDWKKIRLQCIVFKKKTYAYKPVVDLEIRLDLVKFYKLHSFSENDYFYEPAMLIPIIKEDNLYTEIDTSKIESEKLLQDYVGVKNNNIRKDKKLQSNSAIMEIDLHINALLDSVAGMSNTDILEYQLDVVKNTLTKNKQKKGQKVVFIHGKGDGVLRSKILQYLKQNHSNYYVQDASFREYGFGATMVTVQ